MRLSPLPFLVALGAIPGALGTRTAVIPDPLSLVQRATTISSAISDISANIVSLDSFINAYAGGSISSIQASFDDVATSASAATVTVMDSPNLSNLDALNLVAVLQTLSSNMGTAMGDLVNQEPLIAAAGSKAVETILGELQALLQACQTFFDDLTSKCPTSLFALFASISNGVEGSISSAISAFEAIPLTTTTSTASTPLITASHTTTPSSSMAVSATSLSIIRSSSALMSSSTPVISIRPSSTPSRSTSIVRSSSTPSPSVSTPVISIRPSSTPSRSTGIVRSSNTPSSSVSTPVTRTSHSLTSTPVIETRTPTSIFTPSGRLPSQTVATTETTSPCESLTGTETTSTPTTLPAKQTQSTISIPCETVTEIEISSTVITLPAKQTQTSSPIPCETLTEIETSSTTITLPGGGFTSATSTWSAQTGSETLDTTTKKPEQKTSLFGTATAILPEISVNTESSATAPAATGSDSRSTISLTQTAAPSANVLAIPSSGISPPNTLLPAIKTLGGSSEIASESAKVTSLGSTTSRSSTSSEATAPTYPDAAVSHRFNLHFAVSLALCTLMVAFKPAF